MDGRNGSRTASSGDMQESSRIAGIRRPPLLRVLRSLPRTRDALACRHAFLSPLGRGCSESHPHPRLTPWAAFFRRFAAGFVTTALCWSAVLLLLHGVDQLKQLGAIHYFDERLPLGFVANYVDGRSVLDAYARS